MMQPAEDWSRCDPADLLRPRALSRLGRVVVQIGASARGLDQVRAGILIRRPAEGLTLGGWAEQNSQAPRAVDRQLMPGGLRELPVCFVSESAYGLKAQARPRLPR